MTLPCDESHVISDLYQLYANIGDPFNIKFASNTNQFKKNRYPDGSLQPRLQCFSFLIVPGDGEGEDEHDDQDGEEGDGDECDNKSCNESAASLQIILQDIRQLVTVTLKQDTVHTLTSLKTQPEIMTIHKFTGQTVNTGSRTKTLLWEQTNWLYLRTFCFINNE